LKAIAVAGEILARLFDPVARSAGMATARMTGVSSGGAACSAYPLARSFVVPVVMVLIPQ
jgi:hypothetical protein